MASNIQVMKRTKLPYSLHKSEVDNILVTLRNISGKEQNIRQGLEQVVLDIFKSYKNNNFKNNEQLNLKSTQFLLQNIASRNGDFIKSILDNRETVLEVVNDILESLTTQSGLLSDSINKNSKKIDAAFSKTYQNKIKNDIVELFKNIIDEYNTRTPVDTQTEEQPDYIKYIQEKIRKIEDAKPSKSTNKLVGNIVEHISKSSEDNKKSKPVKTVQTSKPNRLKTVQNVGKIITNLKERGISLYKDRKTSLKTAKIKLFGFFQDFKKVSGSKFLELNKNIKDFNKQLKDGDVLLGGAGGSGGIAKSIFRLGSGVFSVLKIGTSLTIGVFKIAKGVVSGTFKFAKNIVKSVVGLTTKMINSLMKPIFPMIYKFMFTPQGAFAVGFLGHALYSRFEKFLKNNGFDGKIVNEGLTNVKNKIRKFIKDIDYDKIITGIKYAAAPAIFIALKKIIEGFLPENIAWKIGKMLGGMVLGWGTHLSSIMGIVKGVMMNPYTIPIALLVGTFTYMIYRFSSTVEKVRKRAEDKQQGRNYAKSINKFQSLKNKYRDDHGFLESNKNLIMKQISLETRGFVSDKEFHKEQLYGRKIADTVIKSAVETGVEENKQKEQIDKIIDFCNSEAETLERERLSIMEDRDKTDINEQLKLAMDVTYTYDGVKMKGNRLPRGTQNPIKLRVQNLIARTEELQKLKRAISGSDTINADNLIKDYEDSLNNLIDIKSSGESTFTKQDFKLWTANIETAGMSGWDKIGKIGYESYTQLTGDIQWGDRDAVERVINFSLNKATFEEEKMEADELFGVENANTWSFKTRTGQTTATSTDILGMCSTAIAMFCNSTVRKEVTPRSLMSLFCDICRSDRVKNEIKFDESNTKMYRFFDMLLTRSIDFRRYFISIPVNEVINPQICKNGFRFISGKTLADNQIYVFAFETEKVNEFNLDEYTKITLESWQDGKFETFVSERDYNTTIPGLCEIITNQEQLQDVRHAPGGRTRVVVKVRNDIRKAACDEMAQNFISFVKPYMLRFMEIQEQIDKGGSSIQALTQNPDNPLVKLENVFNSIGETTENFVEDKFNLTEEKINADKLEKKQLLNSIKATAEKMKKDNEDISFELQSKDDVHKHITGESLLENETAESAKRESGNTSIIETPDESKTRDATISARCKQQKNKA